MSDLAKAMRDPRWRAQATAELQAQFAPYAELTPDTITDDDKTALLTVALHELWNHHQWIMALAEGLGGTAVKRTVKPPSGDDRSEGGSNCKRRGRPPKPETLAKRAQALEVQADPDTGVVQLGELRLTPDQARYVAGLLFQGADIADPQFELSDMELTDDESERQPDTAEGVG